MLDLDHLQSDLLNLKPIFGEDFVKILHLSSRLLARLFTEQKRSDVKHLAPSFSLGLNLKNKLKTFSKKIIIMSH